MIPTYFKQLLKNSPSNFIFKNLLSPAKVPQIALNRCGGGSAASRRSLFSASTTQPTPMTRSRAPRSKMEAPTRDKQRWKCQQETIDTDKQTIYRPNDHFIQGFPLFEEIRRQGKLCDVVLQVTFQFVIKNCTHSLANLATLLSYFLSHQLYLYIYENYSAFNFVFCLRNKVFVILTFVLTITYSKSFPLSLSMSLYIKYSGKFHLNDHVFVTLPLFFFFS